MIVDVQYDCQAEQLPSASQIQAWAGLSLVRLPEAEVCIRLVDPGEMQALNLEFRGQAKTTNVLSFPFEYPPGLPEEAMNYLGDIAICGQVVEQEAIAQKKKLHDHWAHLVVHGMLHLLGYDHQNDDDALEMESLETQLLASIQIADPYQSKDS